MKILILFASLLIFSDQCPPRSQTADNASPGVNATVTDGNVEYLIGHWVHSREEQKDEKVQIFRPKEYKEFPPSRFRMEYIFHKNGECEWYYLSPDDAHRFKTGKWRVDPTNKDVLEITKDDMTERYKIVELTKDKLRLEEIKPDIPGDWNAERIVKSPEFTVRLTQSSLIITNMSKREIYYTVFDSEVASRTTWIPLSAYQNKIAPKGSATLPADKKAEYWPSGTVNVYWWNKGEELEDVRFLSVKFI